MSEAEAPQVPGTMLPVSFLPAIGLVIVRHAHMDGALNKAICHLGGLDWNTGISMLTKVTNTSARADILRNLATTKVLDDPQAIKIHVLVDVIIECSTERNILAHSTPYFTSPPSGSVGYFRDVVRTYPQIKIQPPYRASIKSMEELAQRMDVTTQWLGLMLPTTIPDGSDPEAAEPVPHWWWTDPSQFPWPDRFQRKAEKWSRTQDQIRGSTNAPPQSSQA